MKIKYKDGSLLEATEEFIAHGCNAKGVMGSGIAKAIRDKWPIAYTQYRKVYEMQANKLYLGQVIEVLVEPNKTVFDCITQETYGRDPNVQYVDYDAIRTCIQWIDSKFAYACATQLYEDTPEVAFPLIGAGLGNGDWGVIEKIIEDNSGHFRPVVYRYKD